MGRTEGGSILYLMLDMVVDIHILNTISLISLIFIQSFSFQPLISSSFLF